jgi:hypothetical protein
MSIIDVANIEVHTPGEQTPIVILSRRSISPLVPVVFAMMLQGGTGIFVSMSDIAYTPINLLHRIGSKGIDLLFRVFRHISLRYAIVISR